MDFPFRRLVIWGLRTESHTHRFIHLGFYASAKKAGLDVLWLDNAAANVPLVRSGDLVIGVGVAGSHLPVVNGAKYVLHNFAGSLDDVLAELQWNDYITLQVYTRDLPSAFERIGNCTYFDKGTRTLIQPWGAPLFREEFLRPTAVRSSHLAFWVGSVWDNEQHQGNRNEYRRLKTALRGKRIYLIRAKVSEGVSGLLINRSALAPAIGGRWQVERGYLPCRMFKNVSFGQLGASNIGEFREVFGDGFLHSENIEELVSLNMAVTESQRRQWVLWQQERVAEHTYDKKLGYMARCF